jgi:hypothetical protein
MDSNNFNELNASAFELISLLELTQLTSSNIPAFGNFVGSPQVIMNVGEVSDLKRVKKDPFGNNVSVYQAIDKSYIGLSESNYSKFKELLTQIQELSIFSTKTTFSFLEEEAFDWLIGIYKNKKAEKDLINHLIDVTENEYKEYTFFFKLYPFSIEMPFTIGNSEITFLTEDFIEQEKRKFISTGKKEEDFNSLFKDFKDKVLIKVVAKGVKKSFA